MPLPIIAVIGRPNVGKSTLVNRLAGNQQAIVHDEPGITRDRTYRPGFWQDREFQVVDTGGNQQALVADRQIQRSGC